MLKSVFYITMTVLLIAAYPVFPAAIDNEQSIKVTRGGTHNMLGVLVADEQTDEGNQIVVFTVIKNSAAEKAGIQKDDILLEINGREIESARDLSLDAKKWREKDVLSIKLSRQNKIMTVKATISTLENPGTMIIFSGDGHESDEDSLIETFFYRDTDESGKGQEKERQLSLMVNTEGTPQPGAASTFMSKNKGTYLGVEAETLSPQLAAYFGVKSGVLLETVYEDSPAEKAGLKAGDVITSINKREVADFEDLMRILDYYNPGETVTAKIMRQGSKKTREVTLGDKPAHFSWPGNQEGFRMDGLRQLRMHLPKLRKNMFILRKELRKLSGNRLHEFYLI